MDIPSQNGTGSPLLLPWKPGILVLIASLRADWSLPSGDRLVRGSELKGALTTLSSGLFRQQSWRFPSLLVLLSLCPSTAGML